MKKIRVAVIGAGYLGKLHAEKYALIPNAELAGVSDIARARAEALASRLKTEAYSSYRDLMGRVDAVSIATPTETHSSIAFDFLSNGVDVLVEKPITISIEEAKGLVKEAKRTKRVLQVGLLERFNAAVVEAKKRVKNPIFIEAQRLSPFPDRSTDVDVVLDVMIHDIDIALDLVNSSIESVDAIGSPVLTDKIDMASARIKFKSGAVVDITASRVSKERVRKARIFQSNEYISIDYAGQSISITKILPGAHGDVTRIIEERPELQKTDQILEELKAFISASMLRTRPPVTGEDGLNALNVAHMVQNSINSSLANLLRKGHNR
ncbi:MAG: Gfo/Idh/MocA family oxidoreductase [Deltaproteobacteria bacterium]|nr:Gfo/Idh/MocA family oxidoreductase [Deltaproteobacteria bacterium]